MTASDRRTGDCARYVSETVMWPCPMGGRRFRDRHVDRGHITSWFKLKCLRHPWAERRLSVPMPSMQRGSTSGWFRAAREPDTLRRPQAYSRYRVLCIPPVFRRPFNDKRRCC